MKHPTYIVPACINDIGHEHANIPSKHVKHFQQSKLIRAVEYEVVVQELKGVGNYDSGETLVGTLV